MSFTVSDFQAWARILKEHPEWREEARRLILTDELLEVPQQIREIRERVDLIYEAQQRTEGRVDRLEIALAELAEAQRRSEERLARLEEHGARLDKALAELAEAQRRSEERLARLEEHVARLDKALAELAEAQRRTEERVGRLEVALAELAEAQRRTEERVGAVERRLDRIERELAEFRNAFGSTVEEEAESVVQVILRQKGYRLLGDAFSLSWNGEIDVVVAAEDPQGKKVWALVEAKARLGQRDVRRWSQRVRSAGWHRWLAKRGIEGPFLVYAYSFRRDLGAREVAEKEGIGLLKSEGEILAPAGLIESIVR